MNGGIGGDERQSVCQFKTLLTHSSFQPDSIDAQGGFVDQLQRQTGFYLLLTTIAPGLEHIPGSQSEIFRYQQPDAGHVSAYLIGQQLPDVSFQAAMIAGFNCYLLFAAVGFNFHRGLLLQPEMEFFFVVRIR